MADSQESQQSGATQEGNGHNGSDARKTVVRAAAIAAASGATALAAKKAFGGHDSHGEEGERGTRGKRSGGDSVVTSMASSAWDSARDSLVPMIEDAAESAGEYVAHRAPDVIRESIVPRFIRGFEGAQQSGGD